MFLRVGGDKLVKNHFKSKKQAGCAEIEAKCSYKKKTVYNFFQRQRQIHAPIRPENFIKAPGVK